MMATTTDLESMTIAQLLTYAKDRHGLILGYGPADKLKTRLPKAAIIGQITEREKQEREAQEREQEAREAAEREEARREIEIVPLADQVSVLAAFKDNPENKVNEVMPGTSLTREQIAARIAAARAESAEEAEVRRAAEAAKPRRSDDVSVEELTRRYGKIGYGVGLFIQAVSRLAKETKKADNLALSLGEEAEQRETWDLCKDAMTEGYAKAWDTYQFPSKAMRGMDGEEMIRGIWAEMKKAQPGLAIFARFGDDEIEEGGGED
jgi:hypothetical protein